MKPTVRAIVLGLVLAVCCAGDAGAAFPGDPLLQRFTPADFKATPYLFGLARDGQGRLYVGNTDGVLRMQGRQWDTIALPGGMGAGWLARGSDGNVYLAGHDSFGMIDTDARGGAVYHDLRDAFGLQGSARALGWMGQVLPVADGVYFRAQRELFFYGFSGQRRQWPLAEDNSGFVAWRGNLYTLDMTAGLERFADGKLVPVAGGAIMRGHRGADLVDQGSSAIVISVGGFYRLDAQGVHAIDVPPLPADAGIFTVAHTLAGGQFIVATSHGELLAYDAGAHLLSRHKVAYSAIAALDTDDDHGLWANSEDELIRLQVPSPWSRIGVGDLGGVIADVEQRGDALWLAVGTRGLVRLTAAPGGMQDTWIAGENRNQIFALRSVEEGVLVARDGGIDLVGDDDKVVPLLARDQPVFGIVRSRHDPDLVYAPGDEGVYVLHRSAHHWRYVGLMPAPELATQYLIETAPGVLWVNNTRGLPERWQVDPATARIGKRERFALAAGAGRPDPNQSSQIYALSGQVYVSIGTQVFRFDGRQFVPYSGAPFSYMRNPNAFQVVETPAGAFAYTGARLYRQIADGRWQREDFGAQAPASQTLLRYGSDGVLRVGIWRGLLQFRPDDAAAASATTPLPVRLTAIRRLHADGNGEDLPLTTQGVDAFTQDQSLSVEYTVFSAEPGVEYRYRVPMLNAGWSDWREQSILSLGSMDRPGDYNIEIQGRTPSGRPVLPVSYSFTVLPRWYQITVVRLLFVLAALIVLWVFIRWRDARQARIYLQRQQLLETKIAERTAELEAANHKLAELATEDSLTGIANRRALEAALQREWQRCGDQHEPIGLLMIDVDHFKQFNDRHGHQAGDEVLRQVATRLAIGVQPPRELLARYGGEEFCLLLPGMDATAAAMRAEAARAAFSGADSQVTISIGVAARVPQGDDSPEALLRSADEKLYEAKRRGRNRVEVAGS